MQKRYTRFSMTLASGANTVTEKQTVDGSDKNIVVVASITPEPTADAVTLEIKQDGNTIQDPIPIQFFDGKIGDIEKRGVEIPSLGNAKLEAVVVSQNKNAAQNYYVEVVFIRTDNNGVR